MSLFPKAPFGISAWPIYVARVPAALFASRLFNIYQQLSS